MFATEQLSLPRFASIRSSEANLRTGPSVRYPIIWVYVKSMEPVEIIAEFEQWRKTRDHNGDEGWMHKTMLSGQRRIVVKSIKGQEFQKIYTKPHAASNVVAKVESEVRGSLKTCKKNWCLIKIDASEETGSKKIEGWIEKSKIWGVYVSEFI